MIVVRCDNQLESVDFWRAALEAVKFERLTTRTNGRKVGTNISGKLTLGWEWLGKLTGEFLTALSTERSEQDSRERVLAKASPAHLIPVLQEANALLVIEDFHYLNPGVQKTISNNGRPSWMQRYRWSSSERPTMRVIWLTQTKIW